MSEGCVNEMYIYRIDKQGISRVCGDWLKDITEYICSYYMPECPDWFDDWLSTKSADKAGD